MNVAAFDQQQQMTGKLDDMDVTRVDYSLKVSWWTSIKRACGWTTEPESGTTQQTDNRPIRESTESFEKSIVDEEFNEEPIEKSTEKPIEAYQWSKATKTTSSWRSSFSSGITSIGDALCAIGSAMGRGLLHAYHCPSAFVPFAMLPDKNEDAISNYTNELLEFRDRYPVDAMIKEAVKLAKKDADIDELAADIENDIDRPSENPETSANYFREMTDDPKTREPVVQNDDLDEDTLNTMNDLIDTSLSPAVDKSGKLDDNTSTSDAHPQ